MRNQVLCPYYTLSQLFLTQSYRAYDSVIKVGDQCVIESQLRRRLSVVIKTLGLPVEALTYHSLRRLGASLAFNNNVSFHSIRSHLLFYFTQKSFYMF